MNIRRIIITPGEPAGIGPDLVVQVAQRNWPVELVACADETLIKNRADLLNLPLTLLPYIPTHQPIAQRAGTLTLLSVPLHASVNPGKLNKKNSSYVLDTLAIACDNCTNGKFSALITGPVHKGIMNDAGIKFTGHTEFLEKRTHSKKVVMMLTTQSLRVAFATTHLPIKAISTTINADLLRNVIGILYHDLQKKFGIKQPHILVCGLNPHAGENGYIGTEEIDVIIPILKEMQAIGMHLTGPLPADTIFQPKYLNKADAVLAMYHDQGLPVLKYEGFGYGVNISLGLPFIRTSVDHGTALDLAGKGTANHNSFIAAINLAITLIINSQ